MKLLSVTIPCYNSAGYMRKAIESALEGGDDIEILIINDGSSDNTKEIANEYGKRYPGIVKAINKENGGHGSAVNMGIAKATGLYFKVLDSDDWFDKDSLLNAINLLRKAVTDIIPLDMLICNYVYEKPSVNKQKVISYGSAIPKNKFITWNDVKHFRMSQNLIMHSIIYRTKLLRECNLKLPEHTFYVDNIYAYKPLPYVKYMYYLDTQFISLTGYICNTVNIYRRALELFFFGTIDCCIGCAVDYMTEIPHAEELFNCGTVGDIKLGATNVCSNARVLSLEYFAQLATQLPIGTGY